MRYCFAVAVFLVLGLPSFALAEFEIPEHRWTIGYEYGGVGLRRFLGDRWEVALGGGPNDRRSDYYSENFEQTENDSVPEYTDGNDINKVESGFIWTSAGYRVLREDRFWLTATATFRYSWRNFQTAYFDVYGVDDFSRREEVGHEMVSRLELGLRPAYDITSRVVLMLNFGIYFESSTRTVDNFSHRVYSPGDWRVSQSRDSGGTDRVGVFGASTINSISLIFRL